MNRYWLWLAVAANLLAPIALTALSASPVAREVSK
jgi:hypothetical protein